MDNVFDCNNNEKIRLLAQDFLLPGSWQGCRPSQLSCIEIKSE